MNAEAAKRSTGADREILNFWFADENRRRWFRSTAGFDAEIRARFSGHHAAAVAGLLDPWRATPVGALALLILIDQFSRNLFRGDAKAFAADRYARNIAATAIARRFDMTAAPQAQAFFYLPYMHSETLADQDRSVALSKARLPTTANLDYALEHRAIIARFGRFPHRNAALARRSTADEVQFLARGGFKG